MARNKPKTIEFFGWDFHYRYEKRAKGLTIVYSLRQKGKTIYEQDITVPKKLQTKTDEQIAQEMLPLFLHDMLSFAEDGKAVPEELLLIRKKLPLAMAWIIDRDEISEIQNWASATRKEYERIANTILSLWGEKTLEEIVPEDCDIELKKLSKTDHKRCVQLMRLLYRQEIFKGYSEKNPWRDYQPSIFRASTTSRSAMKRNVENSEFTSGQYRLLVSKCMAKIEARDKDMQLFFGALVLLLMGIDVNELCALTYGSIDTLQYFPDRVSMLITDELCASEHKTQKGGKKKVRYFKQKIEERFRARLLPCSSLVGYAAKIVKESFIDKYGDDPKIMAEYPLIGSKKNLKRHVSPNFFSAWICDEFDDIFQKNRVLLGTGRWTQKEILSMIRRTVESNLNHFGCEEEETRYCLGEEPVTTSGIHYMDFTSDSELNRIGAIQDRWHQQLYQENCVSGRVQKGERVIWSGQNKTPGLAGWAEILIPIKPAEYGVDNSGYIFIAAKRGMTYTVRFASNENKGDGKDEQ